MTSRWWVFLVSALVFMPHGAFAEWGERSAEIQEVLSQCQTAYHRLVDYRGTLQHEVGEGGVILRQDLLDITFRKPGFLAFSWRSGIFKGTALLSRPTWNRGALLIRLGGWFDYLTLTVSPTEVGEPFVPGLKDLSEWLTALFSLAQRPVSDRSLRQLELRTVDPSLADGQVLLVVPAFLIPFRDNTVSTYEFVIERGTGIPMELVLRGAAGDIRQRMTYTDLQINVGVPPQTFEWEENAQVFRTLPGNEADIDVRGFIQNWQRRYVEILDYSGVWEMEERQGEGTRVSVATFKFRKPFDVYLSWNEQQGHVREALLRQGWNDGRVRVRAAFFGLPLIGDLEPEGYLARRGYHYALTEFGLNRLIERLQGQLLHEWLQEELEVHFRGVQEYEGRPCYAIEFSFLHAQEQAFVNSRVVTFWDVSQRVLVKYEAFDWNNQLTERHAFRQLRLNVALTDADFDSANPTYGFLLFRHAPRLDRFLTGRE